MVRHRSPTSETKPKSEYRNPKQTQIQINLKSGKSKTRNPKEACLEFYIFWSFEIVSNFGFRASNFCPWRLWVFARVTLFPILVEPWHFAPSEKRRRAAEAMATADHVSTLSRITTDIHPTNSSQSEHRASFICPICKVEDRRSIVS